MPQKRITNITTKLQTDQSSFISKISMLRAKWKSNQYHSMTKL